MTKVHYLFSAICFILLVYLFSLDTANLNKISELEIKIRKLEETRNNKPLPASNKVDQAHSQKSDKSDVKKTRADETTLDNELVKPEIRQMIDKAIKQHLEKESQAKKAQSMYTSVEFLAKTLGLTERQKEEFWPIMTEFYGGYEQINAGFTGVDKASREAYKYQMQQLHERLKQQLKSILTAQQMEGLEIRLGIQ